MVLDQFRYCLVLFLQKHVRAMLPRRIGQIDFSQLIVSLSTFFIIIGAFTVHAQSPSPNAPAITPQSQGSSELDESLADIAKQLKTESDDAETTADSYVAIVRKLYDDKKPAEAVSAINKIIALLDQHGLQSEQDLTPIFLLNLGTALENSQEKESTAIFWLAIKRGLNPLFEDKHQITAIVPILANLESKYHNDENSFYFKLEQAFLKPEFPFVLGDDFVQETDASQTPHNEQRALALADNMHRLAKKLSDDEDAASALVLLELEQKIRLPFSPETAQPAILLKLANLYQLKASVLSDLEKWRPTIEAGERALQLYTKLPETEKTNRDTMAAMAWNFQFLLAAYDSTKNYDKSKEILPLSMPLAEQLLLKFPNDRDILDLLTLLYLDMGDVPNKPDTKIGFFQKTLDIAKETRRQFGDDDFDFSTILLAAEGIADVYSEEGNNKEAEPFYRMAFDNGKKALENDPDNTDLHFFQDLSAGKLSKYAENNGQLAEALIMKREQVNALLKQVEHGDTSRQSELREARDDLRRLEREVQGKDDKKKPQ